MQILVEMLTGLIAMLAAAILSQFGVDLHTPQSVERTVERVQVCAPEPTNSVTVKTPPTC